MEPNDAALIVTKRWQGLTEKLSVETQPSLFWLTPLVKAMRKHARLGKLFAFIEQDTLCLARNTKKPYADDCPHVRAVGPGRFRAYGAQYTIVIKTTEGGKRRVAEYEFLLEGEIPDILRVMNASLPPQCGDAITGDRDEVRRLDGKPVLDLRARLLIFAADKGNIDRVRDILKSGVNVNAVDYDGFTALMRAVLAGEVEVVRLLLAHGATTNGRSRGEETALSLAVFDNNPEVLKILKEAGAIL